MIENTGAKRMAISGNAAEIGTGVMTRARTVTKIGTEIAKTSTGRGHMTGGTEKIETAAKERKIERGMKAITGIETGIETKTGRRIGTGGR